MNKSFIKCKGGDELTFTTSLFDGRGPKKIPCNECKQVITIAQGCALCIDH